MFLHVSVQISQNVVMYKVRAHSGNSEAPISARPFSHRESPTFSGIKNRRFRNICGQRNTEIMELEKISGIFISFEK
jgi:hypothetical protein